MSRSRTHFEEFQPHTKHKHLILQNYFLTWGHKLGLRAGAGDAVLYVDACAGRGADDIGNQGSPLIAAVASRDAQENVSKRRGKPFTIHVIAVESQKKYFKTLSRLLAPFPNVRVLEGTLFDHLGNLNREFADIPALYFIDPFGLDALDAGMVRTALNGEKREALLLFADQAALRHLGAINSLETKAERRHRDATTELSLFPEQLAEDVEELKHAAAESRAHLDITRENAIRIMNAAFGDDTWLQDVEHVASPKRRQAFLALYSSRLRSWGAPYVLPIPVVDASGVRAYTLIHASKSPKAYAAMKEAVKHALDHSPLPDRVVTRMRSLVHCDLGAVETMVRQRFAGQTVRWAEDTSDRMAPCVRNYVLEETPAFLFPFELEALKVRLKELQMPGRKILYAFPEG